MNDNARRFTLLQSATGVSPQSLESLRRLLQNDSDERIDWSSLPAFGGDEPRCSLQVWSWDAERLLVGDCAANLEIVAR